MTLLRLADISKQYAGLSVFQNVSLNVERNARIGVVGQNGAGKTTLLRIMAGDLAPDGGDVMRVGDVSVALMAQDACFGHNQSPLDVAMSAFGDLAGLERQLRGLEELIASAAPADREPYLRDYGRLMTRFEDEGGYDTHARARETLLGLGFSEDDFDRPATTFSGGEQVRMALARLLLESPDLLLLDEPTNHLDLAASEWLEEYLVKYPGALMMVSHDRYFMDRVVSEIVEVHRGEVTRFPHNYTHYLEAREERRRVRLQHYVRQQEEIERINAFIRRYHAGQRHREAEDRRKKLERMEIQTKPPDYEGGMRLRFPSGRSGGDVLRADDLVIVRGDLCICEGVDLRLYRGDRIALMGPNGAGKTSLLRVLAEEVPPTQGEIHWGVGVHMEYFPQDLSFADESLNLIDELRRMDPRMTMGDARQLLSRFQFSGEEVLDSLETLSGGERTRLHLAKMAAVETSLLILDEPTNHLDLEARRDLEQALLAYDGTVIFVTHDRYFIDRVATGLWVLDTGELFEFSGNYTQYRHYLGRMRLQQQQEEESHRDRRKTRKDSTPSEAKARRIRPEDLASLEETIEEKERLRDELAEELSDPSSYADGGGGSVVNAYREAEKELTALYQRWDELAVRMETQNT